MIRRTLISASALTILLAGCGAAPQDSASNTASESSAVGSGTDADREACTVAEAPLRRFFTELGRFVPLDPQRFVDLEKAHDLALEAIDPLRFTTDSTRLTDTLSVTFDALRAFDVDIQGLRDDTVTLVRSAGDLVEEVCAEVGQPVEVI